MTDKVEVSKKDPCDFCQAVAEYDGKTKMGVWANMCGGCFKKYGVGLGTGKGQKLIERR